MPWTPAAIEALLDELPLREAPRDQRGNPPRIEVKLRKLNPEQRTVYGPATLVGENGKPRDWSRIIGLAGRSTAPDVVNAAAELEKLAVALRSLGSTASVILHHALKEAVEIDLPVHERGDLEYRLLRAVESAAARARRAVTPGRSSKDTAKITADYIARAYYDLTGKMPPTSDPYAYRKGSSHPYHALVQAVFALANNSVWQGQARAAAVRLREEKGKYTSRK